MFCLSKNDDDDDDDNELTVMIMTMVLVEYKSLCVWNACSQQRPVALSMSVSSSRASAERPQRLDPVVH